MSYDAWIFIDTGGAEPAQVEDLGNYTCNVGPMFRLAMPGPYHGGGRYNGTGESEGCGGLPGVSGLRCEVAAEILGKGLAYMRAHAGELRALNPENGWGGYDGVVGFLEQIHGACL